MLVNYFMQIYFYIICEKNAAGKIRIFNENKSIPTNKDVAVLAKRE